MLEKIIESVGRFIAKLLKVIEGIGIVVVTKLVPVVGIFVHFPNLMLCSNFLEVLADYFQPARFVLRYILEKGTSLLEVPALSFVQFGNEIGHPKQPGHALSFAFVESDH